MPIKKKSLKKYFGQFILSSMKYMQLENDTIIKALESW